MIAPAPDPRRLAATRWSWEVLAGHVLAEERWRRTGRIGLEPRPVGLGTPQVDADGVELLGERLILHRGGVSEAVTVTTLAEARRFVLGDTSAPTWGRDLEVHDPPASVPPDSRLSIDPEAGAWLGRWFELGDEVRRALAADDASVEASSPTWWPEHLDIAIEVLPDDRRASYGLSPGDDGVAEPYAYVSVWYPDRIGGLDDPRWDASSFPGALVTARELADRDAPGDELLGWFRIRRDLLAAASGT